MRRVAAGYSVSRLPSGEPAGGRTTVTTPNALQAKAAQAGSRRWPPTGVAARTRPKFLWPRRRVGTGASAAVRSTLARGSGPLAHRLIRQAEWGTACRRPPAGSGRWGHPTSHRPLPSPKREVPGRGLGGDDVRWGRVRPPASGGPLPVDGRPLPEGSSGAGWGRPTPTAARVGSGRVARTTPARDHTSHAGSGDRERPATHLPVATSQGA